MLRFGKKDCSVLNCIHVLFLQTTGVDSSSGIFYFNMLQILCAATMDI